MRLTRPLLTSGVLALLVACGSETTGNTEPGTLTLTLSGSPPAATSAATLQLAGQVTRAPVDPAQNIVVTATGGPNAVSDTATASGAFAFSVILNANAQNSISITATDESGSTGTPLAIAIRHDNQAPQVGTMTPAAGTDGVTASSIQVVFTEPVVPGSPNVLLTRYGTDVPGTVALSADSLTLTFTPTAPLVSNAIHLLTITSTRDGLGNIQTTGGGCFITGGASAQFADPASDPFVGGSPPPALVPLDVLGLRFFQSAGNLFGIVRTSNGRSLDPTSGSNISAWIDIDADQDGSTGFVTAKDTVFSGQLASSGAGAEFVIEFGSFLPGTLGGMTAQYTSQDTVQFLQEFVPATCGTLTGFAIPVTTIGGDGSFDAVGYFDAFHGSTGTSYIDPAPDTGVYSAALIAAGATALPGTARAGGAPFAVPQRARVPHRNR